MMHTQTHGKKLQLFDWIALLHFVQTFSSIKIEMFHFRCEQSFKCLKRCQRLIGVIKLISVFLFAFFHAPFNPV